MIEFLTAYAKSLGYGTKNNPIRPVRAGSKFGLYYPTWYALTTWQQYKKFGLLPRQGSFNDQSLFWWKDVKALDKELSGILPSNG